MFEAEGTAQAKARKSLEKWMNFECSWRSRPLIHRAPGDDALGASAPQSEAARPALRRLGWLPPCILPSVTDVWGTGRSG